MENDKKERKAEREGQKKADANKERQRARTFHDNNTYPRYFRNCSDERLSATTEIRLLQSRAILFSLCAPLLNMMTRNRCHRCSCVEIKKSY